MINGLNKTKHDRGRRYMSKGEKEAKREVGEARRERGNRLVKVVLQGEMGDGRGKVVNKLVKCNS